MSGITCEMTQVFRCRQKKTKQMFDQRIINMNFIKFPTCMFFSPKRSNFPLSYSIAVMSITVETSVEKILVIFYCNEKHLNSKPEKKGSVFKQVLDDFKASTMNN